MPPWIPQPTAGLDVRGLTLSAEDGYLLSRIDGATRVEQLGQLTGLPPERVRAALDRLVRAGAISAAPDAATVAAATEEAEADPADDPADLAAGATHRRLFETRLHDLPEEVRARQAALVDEPELSAYCFDPAPAVIQRVLQNSKAGLAHARLVAAHHGNGRGLELLAARAAFAADAQVQRALWRNPQTPAAVARRLLTAKRLIEAYKLGQSREASERVRQWAREAVRARFSSAAAEERVELIVNTEGRSLLALSGLPLDAKATALLCARTYASSLLVQNLARWAATPPPLLTHLLKQPLVRQQPSLRALLTRHPNCPAHAK